MNKYVKTECGNFHKIYEKGLQKQKRCGNTLILCVTSGIESYLFP